MSEHNEGMPLVPEEDLNLHENFQPIIAENGLIRPNKSEIPEDITVLPDAMLTRIDTVQDLVQIRQAEEEQSKQQEQPVEEVVPAAQPLPSEEEKATSIFPVQPQELPKQDEALPMTQGPEPASLTPAPAVPQEPALPTEKKEDSSRALQPIAPEQTALALPLFKPIFSKLKKRKAKEKKKTPQKQPVPTPESSKQPPEKQASASAPSVKRKPRRWSWALAVLCFLFLGTVSGVVPVENIPLLRNLAYAMGFTKADTARMSFLQALLTWTDKTTHFDKLRGADGTATGSSSWWARLWGKGSNSTAEEVEDLAGLQARAQRANASSSLLDINVLNALQRQKGTKLDQVRGSVLPIPGQEGNQAPSAVLKEDNVQVQTEANRKTGDVFFGSDANAQGRNSQMGFDSINAFKKVPNPYIAGISSLDWIQEMALRMTNDEVALGSENSGREGLRLNWGAGIKNLDKEKGRRDLYAAWITSRMSKYTENLFVKKALAETGFMGAALPTMATNMLGPGGVLIDVNSIEEDQESWKEYLEFEKKCKDAMATSGGKIEEALDNFRAISQSTAKELGYPGNCQEASSITTLEGTPFASNTRTIEKVCKDLDTGYKALAEACEMKIANSQISCDGNSIATTYDGALRGFQKACDDTKAFLLEDWLKTNLANYENEAAAKQYFENNVWPSKAKELTEKDVGLVAKEGDSLINEFIQNSGQEFTTWIRPDKCEKDQDDVLICTPENPQDLEDLKNKTIAPHIIK